MMTIILLIPGVPEDLRVGYPMPDAHCGDRYVGFSSFREENAGDIEFGPELAVGNGDDAPDRQPRLKTAGFPPASKSQ